MYFKDFPVFLYDFNYGNGVTKTSVVKDITRNIRIKKEVLANVSLYDEYDIIDGETPEIIAEKFYGSPEYHWVIMLANEKLDYATDFPMQETVLQRHITEVYNPELRSNDWYWDVHEDGHVYIHLRITTGEPLPFQAEYLTAPVTIKLSDETRKFVKYINFPEDYLGLDENTQYFVFRYGMEEEFGPITQFGEGDETSGVGSIPIIINTTGRENNPIYFINSKGLRVNPTDEGAIPVTGAQVHRYENDQKRKIKIISPQLLEVILKNYEELL
jgi:hypothetical protein